VGPGSNARPQPISHAALRIAPCCTTDRSLIPGPASYLSFMLVASDAAIPEGRRLKAGSAPWVESIQGAALTLTVLSRCMDEGACFSPHDRAAIIFGFYGHITGSVANYQEAGAGAQVFEEGVGRMALYVVLFLKRSAL
jgi:hypothetical protein